MTRRAIVAVALTAIVAAGCGSGDPDAAGDASPGDLGDAVEVMAEAPARADAAACDGDATTLQTAIDTYEVLIGALPTSESDLLDQRLIREPSERYDIAADGSLVAAPGSPCV